jgi:NADH:ubiquinone oxidoreductase subunit 5 (subunit L)/multisubunit Na+/H+ antiporter MnhA subunit
MDRKVIDGTLHLVARVALSIGTFLRFYFDLPVINRFFGDGSAAVVQKAGHELRLTQSGRVQAYLISSVSVAVLIIVGAALYIFLPK